MKYYIIAGEASGDLHGSNLIKAIRSKDKEALIHCWGGDKMEDAGAVLIKHYRELAFMGFVEVIKHLGTILRNMRFCKEDILRFKPDVLVLIDYPGFNIRIAEWAKQQGIKVVYYISPQVWAWKEGRVKTIRKCVDKMLVILPFEVDFYKNWNFDVTYVGHPLIEVVRKEREKPPLNPISSKPVITLLPGSRRQEIETKLPVMLGVVEKFPSYQFVVAQAPAQPDSLYHELIGVKNVQLVSGQTYNILKQSSAALVTSGTATLETALFEVPQVVCYKGNPISYWLATKLIKVKYISLVNLIMDKLVVKELIQDDLTPENLEKELKALLTPGAVAENLKADYRKLSTMLGDGDASSKAADAIMELLSS